MKINKIKFEKFLNYKVGSIRLVTLIFIVLLFVAYYVFIY